MNYSKINSFIIIRNTQLCSPFLTFHPSPLTPAPLTVPLGPL